MTPRTIEDHGRLGSKALRPEQQTDVGFFASDYRADEPSVPMESSERGAEAAKAFANTQAWLICMELATMGCVVGSRHYLSRDRLISTLGMTVNAATGRLGPSGSLQTRGFITCTEDAATSKAGNSVCGYQITDAGMRWIRRAVAVERAS